MTEPLATVVIVTWNGAHLLGPCLDAVRQQSLGDELVHTIVVDNHSTDGTEALLERYPWVRVVRSQVNLGFSGGATLGLRDVQTPYAVVLNNDAQPERDWLEALLAGFTDDVAAVTSKVVLQPRYVALHVGEALGDVATIDSVAVDGRDVTDLVVAQRGGPASAVLVPVADDQRATVTVRGNGAEQEHIIDRDGRLESMSSTASAECSPRRGTELTAGTSKSTAVSTTTTKTSSRSAEQRPLSAPRWFARSAGSTPGSSRTTKTWT